jgi:hypothetical protein
VTPARPKWYAMLSPTTPPPMMTTEAREGSSAGTIALISTRHRLSHDQYSLPHATVHDKQWFVHIIHQ